jgi:hypothetical protein
MWLQLTKRCMGNFHREKQRSHWPHDTCAMDAIAATTLAQRNGGQWEMQLQPSKRRISGLLAHFGTRGARQGVEGGIATG